MRLEVGEGFVSSEAASVVTVFIVPLLFLLFFLPAFLHYRFLLVIAIIAVGVKVGWNAIDNSADQVGFGHLQLLVYFYCFVMGCFGITDNQQSSVSEA